MANGPHDHHEQLRSATKLRNDHHCMQVFSDKPRAGADQAVKGDQGHQESAAARNAGSVEQRLTETLALRIMKTSVVVVSKVRTTSGIPPTRALALAHVDSRRAEDASRGRPLAGFKALSPPVRQRGTDLAPLGH
ncbi:hypothetical protein Slin14017_G062480 [Septoria linicola]|nr:hypothetical protein Slin14017_G062480 [Septoria linicola]